jgi:hypothetical protein
MVSGSRISAVCFASASAHDSFAFCSQNIRRPMDDDDLVEIDAPIYGAFENVNRERREREREGLLVRPNVSSVINPAERFLAEQVRRHTLCSVRDE